MFLSSFINAKVNLIGGMAIGVVMVVICKEMCKKNCQLSSASVAKNHEKGCVRVECRRPTRSTKLRACLLKLHSVAARYPMAIAANGLVEGTRSLLANMTNVP